MRRVWLVGLFFSVFARVIMADATIGVEPDTISETRGYFRSEGRPIPPQGIVALKVTAGGPAAHAKIGAHDVLIIRFHGKTVTTRAEFEQWSASLHPDVPVKLVVLRWLPSKKWQRDDRSITPVTTDRLEDDRLRVSYLKIDGKWVELPEEVVASTVNGVGRIDRFAVGHAGTFYDSARIVQVLGPSDEIVAIPRSGGASDISMRFTHANTDGQIDGSRIDLGAFAIIGTWKYLTTLQAERTILLAVPVDVIDRGLSDDDLKDLKKHLAHD